MSTLEDEIRTRLSRLTQNKIEYEDLWDFGENDGLDEDDFNEDAEEVYKSEEYKLKSGKTISIEQRYNKNYTGSSVWYCCRDLCQFLESRAESINGKNIIELGAGHGLASILLAILGGKVTTTDVPVALKLLQRNIEINKCNYPLDIQAIPLDWGKPFSPAIHPPYDIVVASDCIYNTFYHVPLCETISKLTDKTSQVIIAYGHRGLHQDNFLSVMASKGFSIVEKQTKTLSEDQIVSIVIFQK
eukprot:Phypoly_transcript_13774.p1 GENE.Phypoly_transcript_13774~~Phypoly_transcript_13774.p1  ORF type:complete len:244 (+),score=28.54 Phypoly_transcript_13774:302-1033(+)